jgi:DNA repair protein RadC
MLNIPYADMAEICLSYKSKTKACDRFKISGSKDAYTLFMKNWDRDMIEFIEEAKMLIVNRANQSLGEIKLSSGGTTATVVDPKLVFAAAIKANAAGVLLAHNHPSCVLQPSQADIALTKRISEGGKLFDIMLLDHLIVSAEGYYSFADEGML